jgi:hypothetical protein
VSGPMGSRWPLRTATIQQLASACHSIPQIVIRVIWTDSVLLASCRFHRQPYLSSRSVFSTSAVSSLNTLNLPSVAFIS